MPFGAGGSDRFVSKAHLPTSAPPFGARAPGPVSGQLSRTATWRSRHNVLVSCRLSSTGIGLLGILFPPEDSALLAVGLPTRHEDGSDPVGVSVFRTRETRPGWVPSLLRGGGVLPISAASLIGACRFAAASPIPRWNIPSAELLITEHAKIHSRSPVRPSPRPPPPDGTGTASAFPWASHPAVTHGARQGGDGPSDTGPDHTLIDQPPNGATTHHGEVGPERPADVATGGFLRAASRTRRAPLRAPGAPQVRGDYVRLMLCSATEPRSLFPGSSSG